MFLKVRHVQSLNGGGGVVFATGTPIANSMAEMFTMQRYLQMERLEEAQPPSLRFVGGDVRRTGHGDGTFTGRRGLPAATRRFARFINVPELMQQFRQVADVQTAAMLKLPRPKLDGEKPTIRNAPCYAGVESVRAGTRRTCRDD